MKKLLLSVLLLFVGVVGFGQCPPDTNLNFSTQAEIDAFGVQYPNCTTVSNLIISGVDIIDLTSLSDINVVDGSIGIENNLILENLSGLEGISTKDLNISFNTALQNFNGLSDMTIIGGGGDDLTIVSNPALNSFDGLTNLSFFGNNIYINGNPLLTNIQAFSNLNFNASEPLFLFEIINNSSLISLEGLESFGDTMVHLYIGNNDSLLNLHGLEGITSISFELGIGNNDQLTSLDGIENMVNINDLVLTNNDVLEDISALQNLQSLGLFGISLNPMLSVCSYPNICGFIVSNPNDANIEGNAPGCDSVAEVLANCADCPPDLNLNFTTQAEIDAFGVQYPNCTIISNLFISGADIQDLTPLSGVDNIQGNFEINNNSILENLGGLEGVNISGQSPSINIVNNVSLLSIEDMPTITSTINYLEVSGNPELTSLVGLESMNAVLDINISANENLIDLSGLNGLSTIEVTLDINNNDQLQSLNGLENVSGTINIIQINENSSLASISDLSGLTTLLFDLYVTNNSLLQSLNGLQNIDDTLGNGIYFDVSGNSILFDISALSSIPVDSLGDFTISNNPMLAVCDYPNICEYVNDFPNGPYVISNNAPGCNSASEITDNCIDCPMNPVVLNSQAAVDSFQLNFPGCTAIDVRLTVSGSDITDLSGLSQITSTTNIIEIEDCPNLTTLDGLSTIGLNGSLSGVALINNPQLAFINQFTQPAGPVFSLFIWECPLLTNLNSFSGITNLVDLVIQDNDGLTTLDGLQNLETLEGFSIVLNDALLNLNGLSNVSSAVNELSIGANPLLENLNGLEGITSANDGLIIAGNDNLTSLQGINNIVYTNNLVIGNNEQLTSFEGLNIISGLLYVELINNPLLTDISSLENTEIEMIDFLNIEDNVSLSLCNIEAFCDYFADGGEGEVSNNASGCNSTNEILQSCGLSISEILNPQAIVLFPNPVQETLSIILSSGSALKMATVYSLLGEKLFEATNSTLDFSSMTSGVYFITIETTQGTITKKIVKE